MPLDSPDDPYRPPLSLSVRSVALPPPLPGERPWGVWLTLAFGLAILVGFVFAQGVVAAVWVGIVVAAGGDTNPAALEKIAANGDMLGVASLLSGFVGLFLIWLFIFMRRGLNWREYLAFKRFSWWQIPIWLAVTYGMAMAHGLLAPILGKDEIPQFMLDAYSSAKAPWLLWIAVGLMAPVFEEVLFRGFFYTGWRGERFVFWRMALTMTVTSLIWAGIHLQYGWFELTWIFVFGILLCLAREVSKSLWLPLIMHAANNLVATFVTAKHIAETAAGS